MPADPLMTPRQCSECDRILNEIQAQEAMIASWERTGKDCQELREVREHMRQRLAAFRREAKHEAVA